MYFNYDRSKRRRAEERALRLLQLHCAERHPSMHFSKRKGKRCTLLANWVPVCHVECPQESNVQVEANFLAIPSGLAKTGLDLAAVVQSMRDAGGQLASGPRGSEEALVRL